MSEITKFDALWNYAKPAETEAKFRAMLPEIIAEANPAHHAQFLTQLARTQSLQAKFDEAHAILDEAECLLKFADATARVRYDLERGRTLRSSGKPAESEPYFRQAWERATEEHLDFYAIDAAHMLGIILPSDDALRWNEKAIALAEKSDDTRAKNWLGSLLNNTGWSYHDRGDFETALRLFEQCLAWHRERNTGRGEQIARTLRSMGQIEEALERQTDLLASIRAKGGEEDGYVFEEIGECLLALGRKEEAAPYFAEAYSLLSGDIWLAKNEQGRLERLRELGKIDVIRI